MTRPKAQSGFVLLMVLAVLLIAGTVLAATARHSFQRAVEASAREREIQVRWGSRSCEEFFLNGAERMFKEISSLEPEAMLHRSVVLGGMTFDIVLSDEQAKANINLLATKKTKETLAARLRALQFDQREPVAIVLRPGRPLSWETGVLPAEGTRAPAGGRTGKGDEPPMIYASLDQVFAFESPSQLIATDTDEKCAVRQITCWSDGRLNFKRADAPVMSEVLDGLLDETQIQQLVCFAKDHPDGNLGEALKPMKLSSATLDALRSALTDTSQCHSIWTVVEGRTRNWYRLCVSRTERAEAARGRRWVFEW